MTAAFVYVAADIPPGQTIAQWQSGKVPVLNRRRWWLFLHAGFKA